MKTKYINNVILSALLGGSAMVKGTERSVYKALSPKIG